MGTKTASLAISGLVVLTACSGGGDTTPRQSTTTSTTPGSATTTEPERASVKEYVALVLTQHSALQEEINEIKAPNCTWTTPGKVDPSGSTACAAGITDVGRKAASLSAALKDAMNPAAPTYLGAPPTDIRGLTDETIRVSDQLAAAAGGRTAACVTTDGSDCPSKLAGFEYWMRAMSGVFTGWGIVGT